MERRLARAAEKEKLSLAPFIGIGCPGKIEPDGSIDRGAQNLPGNWTSSRFNLPASLIAAIPRIGEFETTVVMHNDAVPWCKDSARSRSCRTWRSGEYSR